MLVNEKTQQLPLPAVYIQLMEQTEQNPRFHAEGNVLNHTLLVLEQYYRYADYFGLSKEERDLLYWAVVLHDIGKPLVTQWENGRWTARGHEGAGVPVARDILLQHTDFNARQRRSILDLVRWHHIPLRWGLAGMEVEAYQRLATRTDLRLLGIFAFFDLKGRICDRKPRVMEIIRHFNEEIVPSISDRMGDFDHIQHQYQHHSQTYKDTLWQALSCTEIRILERALQVTSSFPRTGQTTPVCYFTLGVPVPDMQAYIDTHHTQDVQLDLQTILERIPEQPSADRQQDLCLQVISRFLQEESRAERNVVLSGSHVDTTFRQRLADIARGIGMEVRYLFFEQPLAYCLEQNRKADTPLPEKLIRQSYRQHHFPHPWEAHHIDFVPEADWRN